MSAYTECVSSTVRSMAPNMGWWFLSIVVACIVVGLVGGIATAGAALPVILAGCLALIGITVAAPLLMWAVGALIGCLSLL